MLENLSLRWSAASRFNDPFDLGFDLHPDYDPETIVSHVLDAWWAGYRGHPDFVARGKLGAAIIALRRMRPGLSRVDFDRISSPGIKQSLKEQEKLLPYLHSQLNEILAGTKILCVSEVRDNILMWSHYCVNHTGIVIQLNCVPEVDSIWGAAKPVRYLQKMPRFLSHAQQVLYLSGQLELQDALELETLIFSKASDWAYEREWRMAQPLQQSTESFQDSSFQPVELGGVILGCRIDANLKSTITALMRSKYPHAAIVQARKSSREFKLEFDDV